MKDPTIGQLKHLATVRAWSDAPNAFSDVDQQFDAGEQHWMRLEPVGGGIYWDGQQTGVGVTHRAFLRFRDGFGGQHVVEYEGRRYRILRATHKDFENRFTVLDLKELGPV